LEKVSGFLPTMDDGPLLATKDYWVFINF
jgi:hypothetical protein